MRGRRFAGPFFFSAHSTLNPSSEFKVPSSKLQVSRMIEPRPPFRIPLRDGRVLDLSGPTKVMAIVNVTPDSFADGGERFDPAVAIADALQMDMQLVRDCMDLLEAAGHTKAANSHSGRAASVTASGRMKLRYRS